MSAFSWIVAAILFGVLAVFLILVVVGNAVSPEFSGRAYLKKNLKRKGLDSDRVPDACVDELVALAERSAKFTAASGQDKYNNAFISMLDTMVDVVKLWISNPNDSMFQAVDGEKDPYRLILEKYDVK